MRSGDGIIEIASQMREKRQLPSKGNDVVSIGQARYPGLAAIKDYLQDQNDHVLITWTNRLRMQGNAEIRRKLGHTSMFPGPKEPIIICKNGQDRLNGEVVFATGFEPGPTLADVKTMWMSLDDGSTLLVSVAGKEQFMDGFMPDVKDWKEYHYHRNKQEMDEPLPITWGYVSTAHKAQGSEYRRVSIYLSESDVTSHHFNKPTRLPDGEEMPFSIRWLYTSLTRSKERAAFYIGI
jgi:ATP-dependent exoDNAse (exonuclease V) alpha subunit